MSNSEVRKCSLRHWVAGTYIMVTRKWYTYCHSKVGKLAILDWQWNTQRSHTIIMWQAPRKRPSNTCDQIYAKETSWHKSWHWDSYVLSVSHWKHEVFIKILLLLFVEIASLILPLLQCRISSFKTGLWEKLRQDWARNFGRIGLETLRQEIGSS